MCTFLVLSFPFVPSLPFTMSSSLFAGAGDGKRMLARSPNPRSVASLIPSSVTVARAQYGGAGRPPTVWVATPTPPSPSRPPSPPPPPNTTLSGAVRAGYVMEVWLLMVAAADEDPAHLPSVLDHERRGLYTARTVEEYVTHMEQGRYSATAHVHMNKRPMPDARMREQFAAYAARTWPDRAFPSLALPVPRDMGTDAYLYTIVPDVTRRPPATPPAPKRARKNPPDSELTQSASFSSSSPSPSSRAPSPLDAVIAFRRRHHGTLEMALGEGNPGGLGAEKLQGLARIRAKFVHPERLPESSLAALLKMEPELDRVREQLDTALLARIQALSVAAPVKEVVAPAAPKKVEKEEKAKEKEEEPDFLKELAAYAARAKTAEKEGEFWWTEEARAEWSPADAALSVNRLSGKGVAGAVAVLNAVAELRAAAAATAARNARTGRSLETHS